MQCKLECDNIRLANIIYGRILAKCRIRDLMKMIREKPDKEFYIVVERKNPLKVDIIVEDEKMYECGERLVIPIPKRFAILEPDENYFRQTLKANIFLALRGAEEKELHV